MNSEIIPKNYSNSSEMLYGAHIVTLVSNKVSYESNVGQFTVPYATTNTSSSSSYSKTLPKNNTSNVINKDNLGTSRVTTSNYITLTVPKHFFYITDIPIRPNTYGCGNGGLGGCSPKNIIIRKEYFKGQKFIVVNAGGNIDEPYIIGVIE